MSKLTRDGTAVPVSRCITILGANAPDKGKCYFPYSADHVQDFFFLFFFFHLTYSRWTSSSSCLWSQRIFPSLPGSRLTIFLSRCKFSTLTTRQPMVEFYGLQPLLYPAQLINIYSFYMCDLYIIYLELYAYILFATHVCMLVYCVNYYIRSI